MSRDWTPKEFDMVNKQFEHPSMVDMGWVIHIDGQEDRPMYNREQIDLAHAYPNLGRFGLDFLFNCLKRGYTKSPKGQKILREIEDYFDGKEPGDERLKETTKMWYEGKLEPGRYMDRNNEAFVDFVGKMIEGE